MFCSRISAWKCQRWFRRNFPMFRSLQIALWKEMFVSFCIELSNTYFLMIYVSWRIDDILPILFRWNYIQMNFQAKRSRERQHEESGRMFFNGWEGAAFVGFLAANAYEWHYSHESSLKCHLKITHHCYSSSTHTSARCSATKVLVRI